jgi:hypothetical protein
MHVLPVGPTIPIVPLHHHDAPQRVVKVRRDYNTWVASETMEDYALRFTPQRFRKWSTWRVANTAFGAASFLILEAVGATLLVQYGFLNAFWAILATGLIIFLAGLPISIYAARYGVDMDLLTRGAGFGYIGSTLTSLIYASFTFIFFALEAAVMAYALELALGIPPSWGYLVCALVVIPLVTHGVSVISRLQVWTQPLWLVMLVVPFVYVLVRDPGAFAGITHYAGERRRRRLRSALVWCRTDRGHRPHHADGRTGRLPALHAGAQRAPTGAPGGWACWPAARAGCCWAWPRCWGGAARLSRHQPHGAARSRGGPQPDVPGGLRVRVPALRWAVAATALFVVISQLKINVTNAYAGSLAWSNFFSRLTHSHRAAWCGWCSTR